MAHYSFIMNLLDRSALLKQMESPFLPLSSQFPPAPTNIQAIKEQLRIVCGQFLLSWKAITILLPGH